MRWIILILAAANALACQPVDGGRIRGKDLAAANPIFAPLNPELEIAFTPLAGVQRTMRPAELLAIARAHGISIDAPVAPVCFERVAETLTAERLEPVLRAALGKTPAGEDEPFEIADFGRYGVPKGTLGFTHVNLNSTGLWRGRVIYDDHRSAPVWVKIRLTGVAPAAVPRSAPLVPPGADALVERGDTVQVEVTSGSAILKFESKAESRGHAGEWVLLRNPENEHLFRAKVEAAGRVSIQK